MRRPGTNHFLCIIKYWKLNTAGIHVDSNQSELFSKGFSCVTSKKFTSKSSLRSKVQQCCIWKLWDMKKSNMLKHSLGFKNLAWIITAPPTSYGILNNLFKCCLSLAYSDYTHEIIESRQFGLCGLVKLYLPKGQHFEEGQNYLNKYT